MGWTCFPPLVWQSSQQAPPREEVVPVERISIVFQPVIILGYLYHWGYRDILCFNLSILGYLYHWRRRFRDSGRRRQLRRRRRRCKRCWEADKTWRRPWPAQVEVRLSIAEIKDQISITKVYNLHGRLIQFFVINLLIGHLGRPRIDWNSDVEPRPKPPNRSWAPAIENQGNKYVMDGSYEAAPLWELCRKDDPWLEEGGSKLGSETFEVDEIINIRLVK